MVCNLDSELKQILEFIIQKLDNIEKRQESMEIRLESMEIRQESMEKKQDEIYSVVKTIEHSNNVRKAEIDNLTYKVAHIEGTINGIGELIQSSRSIK